ncbi:MAG: chemotaxis protein CheW [candidate division NC10 bacterium]|nr:chemotaxis protein CheW [candidate division NC10 bacterium]
MEARGIEEDLLLQEEERESSLILFKVGGEWFALPIEGVKEIHPLGRVTRIPNAPHGVIGIMNLRGRILTLYDLQTSLGGAKGPKGEEAHVIVLDLDPELDVGIMVDKVAAVRTAPSGELEAPLGSTSLPGAPLVGIAQMDEVAAGILDLRRLFSQIIERG